MTLAPVLQHLQTSLKPVGQLNLKFHMETFDMGTKVLLNSPGQNLLKYFSRTRKLMTLGLGMQLGDAGLPSLFK